MDVDALLSARDAENPSGEDLEYDPAFAELNEATRGKEERQVGDVLEAAEEPDYAVVAEKAMVILEQSHDLRAAVFWTTAVLRTRGLVGFAEGLQYIRGCLEQHWETCFPRLDDEDSDPTFRVNTIQTLSDDSALKGVRRAPLTDSRAFGKLSFRDIQVAQGSIAAPDDMDSIPDTGTVAGAFEETDKTHLAELSSAVQSAQADIGQIDLVFLEHAPGQGPDLDDLSKALTQISDQLESYSGSTEEGPTEGGEGAVETGDVSLGSSGPSGAIRTPQDVSNALDRIIVYYQRNEPSSPVPLLLERAKRLVGADFVSIVRDIAPEGMGNVTRVGGLPEDEEY